MTKFNKYILNSKFRGIGNIVNRIDDGFEHQFGKHVEPRKKTQFKLSDAQGIERAYKDGDTYVHGKTMYVAGSHTLRDWWDDATKIPIWGDLRKSARYMAAEKELKNNPQIENVVGHSLGGSVVLELQKQYPDRGLKSRTYGAPVWDPLGLDRVPYDTWKSLGKPDHGFTPEMPERFRNYGDIVSIFDASSNDNLKLNPFDNFSSFHTYHNIGENKYIEEDYGTK